MKEKITSPFGIFWKAHQVIEKTLFPSISVFREEMPSLYIIELVTEYLCFQKVSVDPSGVPNW